MENKNEDFQDWPGVHPTLGEILTGGVVYELVQSRSGHGVELLRWEAETYEIGPQFREGEIIYTAGYLHPSLLEATRLADGPAEYGDGGKLFWKIVDLLRHYMGLSKDAAASITRAALSTWFSDCSASPITLCITGMDMNQVMKLFRLVHILCRRPLRVAALSANLPFYLHPTLLINAPRMSARTGDFWRASNFRGTFIPGPKGTMRNIACAKIIFCETEAARRTWGPEALYIALPPTCQGFASLSELEETQLASEYQPQLLMFRLRNLSLMDQSYGSSRPPTFAGFAPAESLPACIAEDPEIRKALTPLLEAHEQDLLASRALNPYVAIVEVIWTAAHDKKEISTAEITERVNALLRDRGETWMYNANEIGWKLANLGLSRRHNGQRKVVRFTREMRRRVHQLAAQFGLQLPQRAECADCNDAQLIDQK
jgi:hypothetical protein